ncbi:MAG: hypothetical protein A4E32_01734 [Methanomassiliicoccales archaeon PtaU1.Bin124]|nr:MAG: hypothetical protein A4E32_01734 [Methanomassiliicoccales archaeon PtaU1.Bin124]
MPSAVTIGERIILHLAQYSKFQQNFEAPAEVSQDGIAEALRISRAHAAIELKKLKEVAEVEERIAHIRKGPTKRKVYFLTEAGEKRAKNLKDYVEKQGIELAPLLDLKRCKGPELWDSLDEEQRPVLGMASVFRKPFRRSILPETTISLLPEDKTGMVDMPQDLKESVPALVFEDDLRQYHSHAADYWLKEGDYKERLYHLLKAKRTKEVEMMVASKGPVLIELADKDVLADLLLVPTASEKYGPRIINTTGLVAQAIGDTKTALAMADSLISSEPTEDKVIGAKLKAIVLLGTNRPKEALDVLNEARSCVPSDVTDLEMECLSAESLSRTGQHKAARDGLNALLGKEQVRKDPDAVERLYHQMGKVFLAEGNPADAVKYLSKALGLARPGDKKRIHETMYLAYDKLGQKEKAKEHATLAGIKRSGWTGAGPDL